jgi:uncharacterized protein (TIGR02145 family)
VNDLRGLAPEGWHIPTYGEFQTLEIAVNQNGNSLKSKEQGNGNGVGTNTTGFSALFAGGRLSFGQFKLIEISTYNVAIFWSSTKYGNFDAAYLFYLFSHDSSSGLNYDDFESGYSVRCVKD